MDYIKEKNRIYAEDESGNILAEIIFPETEVGVFCIERTFVDDSLRGQGIAGKLVEMAVESIADVEGKVTATCSYAKQWLEKHSRCCSAEEALQKLRDGNRAYVESNKNSGDISSEIRMKTHDKGQRPYAIIVGCSDSRAIPEVIFNAGIGDLFVIRVAGNVIDDHQLGSIEYAVDHLGTNLVVVLGHDHCGAVDAAMHHDPDGHIKYITDEILKAIGDEKDEFTACCLNAKHSVKMIEENADIKHLEEHGLKIISAVYHLDSGIVDFD